MIEVKLTSEELDALRALTLTTHGQLLKDKHAASATVEFYYKLQDKLMLAKIRAK